MPRKSLAEEYYQEAESDDVEDSNWILIYDFKEIKPNPKFWTNLRRLRALGGESTMVQYSVLLTNRRRVVKVAKRLVEHYGGNAIVFKGERIEP